jgi:hypothetical protein
LGRESARTRLPWVNRRPRQWEIEPLRYLGVQFMYLLFGMADAREERTGKPMTSRLASFANWLTGRG